MGEEQCFQPMELRKLGVCMQWNEAGALPHATHRMDSMGQRLTIRAEAVKPEGSTDASFT